MLFDLRGRGRRRTVQVIYLFLAILIGGGLVFFGVGSGNGVGGLANVPNSGSGNSAAQQYVSQQTQTAEKQVKLQPNNPQAWATLVQDRYDDASVSSNGTSYTTSGKKDLAAAAAAWTHYLQLQKNPDPTLTRLMAQAYADLGDYNHAAQTWQILSAANPKVPIYWEYVAVTAYQAKETDLGDLASAKALSLVPKSERAGLKTQLDAAKAQASTTSTSAG